VDCGREAGKAGADERDQKTNAIKETKRILRSLIMRALLL
jgi:hypothetical protein